MNATQIIKELKFKAVRSSGSGGQHVNKVSSKIELTFDLENSNSLSEFEKEVLKTKLSSRLTKEKILILFCEETRSQHRNKGIAIKRFLELIKTLLIRPKKRRPSKPSLSSIKKKTEHKKRTSIKKALRKKPRLD
ncbi:MAG: alternative ribosome rescue aminoacyl-tRNA hydrolase ArfB [Polaribacter sp.]|nr:aminoacyl-tRNA hydrolase [Polaribacter sp.]MBT6082739.1 aminoacyl-tRNA hydrolase [Polaribacter sp.]MBT7135995.1 aminoacyl-tRNA hydrolase [Polaribacter sp.]MDG1172303.1 alternative ribosome rescue aminoacyl-tRNA hydrolase ArfB [Polaribacter sp.]MDG1451940.1 alternative ribosome rescue aminoacyl-tRNA hydrolase ArfB [Polaribacter sp.]